MAVLMMVAMLPAINNTGCTLWSLFCPHATCVTLTSSWVVWAITNSIYKSLKLSNGHIPMTCWQTGNTSDV